MASHHHMFTLQPYSALPPEHHTVGKIITSASSSPFPKFLAHLQSVNTGDVATSYQPTDCRGSHLSNLWRGRERGGREDERNFIKQTLRKWRPGFLTEVRNTRCPDWLTVLTQSYREDALNYVLNLWPTDVPYSFNIFLEDKIVGSFFH